jgi:hypothetical protein
MSQMRCSTTCGRGCTIQDGPDQIPDIGWEQGTELTSDLGVGMGLEFTTMNGDSRLQLQTHIDGLGG